MLLSPKTYIMHLTSVADCRQLCFIRLSPPHRDRAVTERLLKPPKDGGDRPSWSCTLNGVSRFGFHRRQKSCQLQLALIRRESDPPREKRLEVTKYICRALQRRIEIGNAFSSGPPLRRSSRFQPGSRSQTHDSVVSFIFLSLPRYYPKNSDEDHFGSPTFDQRFTSIFEQSYHWSAGVSVLSLCDHCAHSGRRYGG